MGVELGKGGYGSVKILTNKKVSNNMFTMPLTFVYRTTDIFLCAILTARRWSADISAVRYTNLNGMVLRGK